MKKSLLNRMKNRAKPVRNTKPLNMTLVNLSASKLTKNQIMNLLKYDPVLLKNTMRAIEHRVKNIRNNAFQSFMKNYYRKKYM